MEHPEILNQPPVARETATRNTAGTLIYCHDLFEKDLYKNHMPQVLGEELQLATPLRPSPTAITPATPVAKKQRGTNVRL